MPTTIETHELRLIDPRATPTPRVEYHRVRRGPGLVEAIHRFLPNECSVLVGADGRVDIDELTDEQRAWVDAELDGGIRA